MLKAILLKEYCKLRVSWQAFFVLHCLVTGYLFIDTRQLFTIYKPEMVWYQVMHLGQINYDLLKELPAAIGACIAFAQFLPEMREQRLRLTLHLPVCPHQLIITHILAGLLAICAILLPNLMALVFITNLYFPSEMGFIALRTALPWVCAGFASYIGTSAALLEPGLKLRFLNIGITCGVAGLFLFSAEPDGYSHLLPLLLVPLLLMVPSVLLPAYHFRFRRVSE